MLPTLCATLLAGLATGTPAPLVMPQPGGELALVHGVLSGPSSGDLREAARRFVLERRAELGLPATSTLGPARAFSTRFGGSVHFAQLVVGVPVQGGGVVVTFDTEGRVVRVASSLRPYSRVVMAWVVSGEAAQRVAAGEIDGALLKPDGAPWGGYSPRAFVVGDELHAGFTVYVPTLRRSEAWYVAVDATDGAVLFVEDRARAANDARVYAVSPGGLDAGVGVMPTTQVVLGHFPAGFDGGGLTGTQVRAFNCCPTAGCDLDAGAPARRAVGQFNSPGGPVSYDVAICDRVQRASNDPQVNPSANFVYAPVDPPTTPAPSSASLADSDEFAEVNAYFHVNEVYDFARTLSQGPLAADAGFAEFAMRDAANGKVPAVWVNVSDPDFQAAAQDDAGVYVSNALSRTDNAMFVALENMAVMSVPEQAFDTDALVIYQGDKVDFSYDAPVVWHEFGHGIVYSTANWDTFATVDARSANNESSALHEGVADVWAFMVGQESKVGVYIGPRTDPTMSVLRDANNTWACPDVLWGESHQDSQHFVGALWQARTTLFQGTDQGRTFDAAFYAALVSFPLDVNFEKAAAIIASAVGLAFPSMSDAEAQMRAVLNARGVSSCSKVLEVTAATPPRYYYNVPGSMIAGLADTTPVPGPLQLKLHVPAGAKSVRVRGQSASYGTVRLQVLAKRGQAITFTRNGTALTNDADAMLVPAITGGLLDGTVPIDVPCGGDVYVTLANTSRRDRAVMALTVSATAATTCEVDAGQPDAGQPDAGPAMVELVAAGEPLGAPLRGCGCTGAPGVAGLGLLALLGWRLRRRR